MRGITELKNEQSIQKTIQRDLVILLYRSSSFEFGDVWNVFFHIVISPVPPVSPVSPVSPGANGEDPGLGGAVRCARLRCARQILDSLLSIQPRLGAALAWSFWSVRFASRLRRRRMMKAVLETENCFEL